MPDGANRSFRVGGGGRRDLTTSPDVAAGGARSRLCVRLGGIVEGRVGGLAPAMVDGMVVGI